MFDISHLSPEMMDILIIKPRQVHHDARGAFLEAYRVDDLADMIGGDLRFVQGNESWSQPYVLRGMHFQVKEPQGKLIRVIQGSIYDVAVDLRQSSRHFGKWVGKHLAAQDHEGLYIPPGFAHGFLSLGDGAVVTYQTTTYHNPMWDRTLRWNCPEVGIRWPLMANASVNMSAKDRTAPGFADLGQVFD